MFFGVWKENELVPIGKAYSGYTDKELLVLDKFIRNNTTNKFGPVREVKKEIMKIYKNLSSNKETSIGELIKESIHALSSDSDNATISRIAKEVLQGE